MCKHRFCEPALAARIAVALLAVCLIGQHGWGRAAAQGEPRAVRHPQVTLETSLGRIVIELAPDRAPRTVENFVRYVRDGFYEGSTFHRVVPGYVIQAGGYTSALTRKGTHPAIRNEAAGGLRNLKYTVAMARGGDPHSATSQFFINLKDNPSLDPGPQQRWGYCAFGWVIEGTDVVEAIAQVPTTVRKGRRSVPVTPVVINRATVTGP